MEKPDQIILGLFIVAFLGGVYIKKKISEHDKEIEDLRQINIDTWTI